MKRSKEFGTFTRKTGAALLAGAAITLMGCSAADKPQPQGVEQSQGIDDKAIEFAKQFDQLAPATEVIAKPLTITGRAEQRDLLFRVNHLDPVFAGYEENLAEASAALAGVTDPVVVEEAQRYYDSELSDGVVSTYGVSVYSDDPDVINDNRQLVVARRTQAADIADTKLRDASLQLLDLNLAELVVEYDSQPMTVSAEGVLGLLPTELQQVAKAAYENDDNKSSLNELAQQKSEEVNALKAVSSDWIKGSEHGANFANLLLEDYAKYRSENPDEQLPAVKDLLLTAIEAVDTPEEAELVKAEIGTVPKRFEIAQKEAEKYFDKQVATAIIDIDPTDYSYGVTSLEHATDTVGDIQALVGSAFDAKEKARLAELSTVLLAYQYATLGDSYTDDMEARDQYILGQLPDASKYKQLALAARGGDAESLEALEEITEALKDEVEPYTAIIALENGSNRQADEINTRAAEYLRLNS